MSQTYRLWQNAWRDDPLASVTRMTGPSRSTGCLRMTTAP